MNKKLFKSVLSKGIKMPENNDIWMDALLPFNTIIEEASKNAQEKTMPTFSEKHHAAAIEDIRENLHITVNPGQTVITLVIIDLHNKENNLPKHIHCDEGICFSGYLRDVAKDSYIVECVVFFSLGSISATFQIQLPWSGGWKTPIPLSAKTVEAFISPYHKKLLKSFKEQYPTDKFGYHFMQMISAN